MTAASTRRTDRRLATVAEIKAAAWADIQDAGTPECSLRAVARRLGMAPSALYRYFPSRDDLLTALIVDAFDDLTAVLTRAHAAATAAAPRDDPARVFVDVAAAHRTWAIQDPLRYRLALGTPVGGYVGNDSTTAAARRASGVMVSVMVDLVSADAVDLDRVEQGLTSAAGTAFSAWGSELPTPLPPAALAVAMDCYAAMHGAIQLEVNGHLPPPLRGRPEVFTGTMRRVLAAALR